MLLILFLIFVVTGFLFHFLATWPVTPFATRIAWGAWLIASLIWAYQHVGK
jgi:hypothetical protein